MAVELQRPIGLYWVLLLILLLLLSQFLHVSEGQQAYINNAQLNCGNNNSNTKGYECNNGASSTCVSYLTFRSDPPNYDSPAAIGYLLDADPSQIAAANNITDIDRIPKDTIVIVPVNCSCSDRYYQHNASYVLKFEGETYFILANNTYQGLTTCQAMMAENIYEYKYLSVGLNLVVPLRCACPTSNQIASGIKYLLTYLVIQNDDVSAIAQMFGLGNDYQRILDANQLSSNSVIYPFTTLLVPLDSVPTKISLTDVSSSTPPPSQSTTPIVPTKSSSKKGVYIGAAIGAVLLVLTLSGLLVFFFRRRRTQKGRPVPISALDKKFPETEIFVAKSETKSNSISMEGIRYAIESLTMYKIEELQEATGFFSESKRIKGSSVYKGRFRGYCAAVKIMKGDVSSEINILKQINHYSIIRLSGICVHEGNTYLVYEYAENGSLSEWLQQQLNKYDYQSLSSDDVCLGWKQRVQIAYDVAGALNYLHNYSNPPYVHKNLNSSNVLLDGNLRAKVANFGLARKSAKNEEEGGGMMLLTRHVVGTQGYMAPEYIENGLITPKLDVFAFGVVTLELLSGREAMAGKNGDHDKKEEDGLSLLLSSSIKVVLEGDNAREKLRGFMDPGLRQQDYPLDLAFSLAQLAYKCVAHDLNSRPPISEVCTTLSKILSSSSDWDPSNELHRSRSVLSMQAAQPVD